MTKRNYLKIYDSWKNKALNKGYTFKQFQYHINRFLTGDKKECPMTLAICAKLAFKALEEEKEIQLSLENVSWTF